MSTSSPTIRPPRRTSRKSSTGSRATPQPNDLVVIYVATHGTPRTTDTAGGANYLVTYDTEVYNGGNLDEDALYATAYPMVELADAVSTRMKALRTAVFLDTCYSGGAAGDNACPLRSPTPLPPAPCSRTCPREPAAS